MPALALFWHGPVPAPHAKSLILAGCLVVAWFAPRLAEPFFGSFERLGARLAARPSLAMIGVAVAVILLRLSLTRTKVALSKAQAGGSQAWSIHRMAAHMAATLSTTPIQGLEF